MKEYTWFYETIRVIARILVPLIIRLRVVDVENVPKKGPVILVSNHLNWTDVPIIAYPVMRRTHYMAKSELFQKAPLKWLVIGMGGFPVRRGEADRQAIKQADEVLKAGQVLVIFPEGTRSRTRKMKAGLAGVALIALRSGAPIVPVGIYGSEKFKPWHLWPFRTPITLTYGKPFTLTREGRREHGDLQAQLDVIMRRIAELLPPEYRGIYGEAEASASASAPDTPASPPEHASDRAPDAQGGDTQARVEAGAGEQSIEEGMAGG